MDASICTSPVTMAQVWAFGRATGRSVWTQNNLKYRNVSAPAMLDRFALKGRRGHYHWLPNELVTCLPPVCGWRQIQNSSQKPAR